MSPLADCPKNHPAPYRAAHHAGSPASLCRTIVTWPPAVDPKKTMLGGASTSDPAMGAQRSVPRCSRRRSHTDEGRDGSSRGGTAPHRENMKSIVTCQGQVPLHLHLPALAPENSELGLKSSVMHRIPSPSPPPSPPAGQTHIDEAGRRVAAVAHTQKRASQRCH